MSDRGGNWTGLPSSAAMNEYPNCLRGPAVVSSTQQESIHSVRRHWRNGGVL